MKKVSIYIVDPDVDDPTILLKDFLTGYPEFNDLLGCILSQPGNKFNGYVRITVKYLQSIVNLKVIIPDSLNEPNRDEVKYHKTITFKRIERLSSLIKPIPKFILAQELLQDKWLKNYY